MPELLRKLPARMNSGTASRAKFCVSVTVSWIGMVNGSSGCCRKNSVPEMPMANATGMPISSSTVKAMRTISMAYPIEARLLGGSKDVHGPALRLLAVQLGPHLERGRDQQQHAPRPGGSWSPRNS